SPVAPYDFARKSGWAEELVAKDLHIVAGTGIDVHDHRTVRGEKLPHHGQSIAQARQIRRQIGPAVVESGRAVTQNLARPVALAGHLVMHAPGEERRIEVGERRSTSEV